MQTTAQMEAKKRKGDAKSSLGTVNYHTQNGVSRLTVSTYFDLRKAERDVAAERSRRECVANLQGGTHEAQLKRSKTVHNFSVFNL